MTIKLHPKPSLYAAFKRVYGLCGINLKFLGDRATGIFFTKFKNVGNFAGLIGSLKSLPQVDWMVS